ncbi:hypothetical protein [Blastochloris tepida]|uniref:Bacteriophage protein n=1 Tax=Blastochloris tepida TaxID=2233851 RepID=A0A348FYI3_9HYPH|nr:hypothetical protein [Blastochloris tepida]BBF92366.1 hypothetical protein BLTE_10510 [Blastochloris tepida]
MALTQERDTPMRDGAIYRHPVAASTKILKGALVVLDAGNAKPGATATGLIAAGRAEETVDNSSGSAGDVWITVRRGVFRFANKADDAVTQADVGKDCYVVDDATVAKTTAANTRSKAGTVRAVEAGGVWVEI